MREKWRRFQRLSGREQRLLVKALLLFRVTSIGLRLLGYKRWKWVLERLGPLRLAESTGQLKVARETARIMNSAARHSLGCPTCLEQSLVLWWFLRRKGIPAKLRIGARKETNRFEAHAWVEWEGVAFDGNEAHQHFVPFENSVISVETGVS